MGVAVVDNSTSQYRHNLEQLGRISLSRLEAPDTASRCRTFSIYIVLLMLIFVVLVPCISIIFSFVLYMVRSAHVRSHHVHLCKGRVMHQLGSEDEQYFQPYGKDESECNFSISRYELNK